MKATIDLAKKMGFDHRIGHFWPLSMTVDPFLISFFAPCIRVVPQ
jgi:hypothetical protein